MLDYRVLGGFAVENGGATLNGHQVVALRGHSGVVSDVQFSEDGSQLMSASADGAVRIWALRLDDLEDIARDNITRGLTAEECRRYLHEARCPA